MNSLSHFLHLLQLLGMIPEHMLEQSTDQHRLQFFEKNRSSSSGREEWAIKQQNSTSGSSRSGSSSTKELVVPSPDPIASLTEVIRAETHRKKKYPPSETGNSPRNYESFVDLISRMLSFDPRKRIKPDEALSHPFITEQLSASSAS
jgi:serine/threonine protein kinase